MPCASASTWISMWRGPVDEALDEQRVVAERAARLAAGARRSPRRSSTGVGDQAHALAAAAGATA